MALAFDEFGRPFIILREQEKKIRVSGVTVLWAACRIMRSSYLWGSGCFLLMWKETRHFYVV
ncbi:hypothetical protein ABZP36_012696, partial [Zizania latifolia]